MALLHVLEQLRELRLEIVVAHLNHGLRGEESDADARHVREAAGRLGFAFECRETDAEAFRKSRGLSLEDAARKLRYGFFREVLEKRSASRIATGHTLDDQAETVVMRLLRGSGSLGLSGIRPVAGKVVRPLINATKKEAREYLVSRGVSWREDSTNSSDRFTRNRIRNELMPLLETYNPAVGKFSPARRRSARWSRTSWSRRPKGDSRTWFPGSAAGFSERPATFCASPPR